jgi:hypothetical protein
MRRESSRGPSNRWPGASDDTIQLSTTAPTLEPIMPPMAAAEAPRIEPPIEPPMAVPAAPRTRVAINGSGLKRNEVSAVYVPSALRLRSSVGFG